MTDQERKAMQMALDALEWSWGGEPLGTKEFEAITALRKALDHVPDTMKMLEPDMGIDRGAWDDVPDATKWVDELRGGDETEQEPVAWMYVNEDGECEQIEYGVSTVEAPYITLLYTAPPSKQEPVAWVKEGKVRVGFGRIEERKYVQFDQTLPIGTKLFAAPVSKQEWVSLTDEEIHKDEKIMVANIGYGATFETLRELVKAIDAKLKEKNNG